MNENDSGNNVSLGVIAAVSSVLIPCQTMSRLYLQDCFHAQQFCRSKEFLQPFAEITNQRKHNQSNEVISLAPVTKRQEKKN